MTPHPTLPPLLATAICALSPLALSAHAEEAASSSASASASASSSRAQRIEREQGTQEHDAKLAAARKKLEEAAREVAELSTQGIWFDTEIGSRAIIGALLNIADNEEEGLGVINVSPGGPAAEAGLRAGDRIVAINGIDVRGREAARKGLRSLREVKPDTKVSIKLIRDGKQLELSVTPRQGPVFAHMSPMPLMPAVPAMPVPPMPPLRALGPLANMELATLTPQLGHYFGSDKGVLVVRAPEEGALGLKDGDVILSIDGREATNAGHVTRILASYQSGEKISLHIVRERKSQTLEGTLPAGSGNEVYRFRLQRGPTEGPGGIVPMEGPGGGRGPGGRGPRPAGVPQPPPPENL